MTQFSDAMLSFLMREFGLKTKIVKSSNLEDLSGWKTELVISICTSLEASTYLSGVGAKSYLDEGRFHSSRIRIEYQEFVHPRYPTMHADKSEGHGLCSLDFLLNMGPTEAKRLLSSARS